MKPKTTREIAQELDNVAGELTLQTIDSTLDEEQKRLRKAEIANIRQGLYYLMEGFGGKEDEELTELANRLLKLREDVSSAGRHTRTPRPLNNFEPLKG